MQFDWKISPEMTKKTWENNDFIIDYLINHDVPDKESAEIIKNAISRDKNFLPLYLKKTKSTIFDNELLSADYNFLLSDNVLNFFIAHPQNYNDLMQYLEHIVYIENKQSMRDVINYERITSEFLEGVSDFLDKKSINEETQELITKLLATHKSLRFSSLNTLTQQEYDNLDENQWVYILKKIKNSETLQDIMSYNLPIDKIRKLDNIVEVLSLMISNGLNYNQQEILKNEYMQEKIASLSEEQKISLLQKADATSSYTVEIINILNIKKVPISLIEKNPLLLSYDIKKHKVINEVAKDYPERLLEILKKSDNTLLEASTNLPASFWLNNIKTPEDAHLYERYLLSNFDIFTGKKVPSFFFTKKVIYKLTDSILCFMPHRQHVNAALRDKSLACACLKNNPDIYQEDFFPKEFKNDSEILAILINSGKKISLTHEFYENAEFWKEYLSKHTINSHFPHLNRLAQNVISDSEIGMIIMKKLDQKEIRLKDLPIAMKEYLLVNAREVKSYAHFFEVQLERQRLNEIMSLSNKNAKTLKI